MASTYVNNLRVAEPANGDADWGTSTNTSLELIGEALGVGTEAITTNADTHTSTVADGATDPARALHLQYTGTLDSACTITIAPNTLKRVQIIENATSGGQSIIIKQGSGATITILNGTKRIVYLDGAGSGAAVVDITAAAFGAQAFYVPSGTTGNRPTGVAGAFRYNTTTGAFEGYTDSWGDIGGSGATNVSLNEFTGNGSTTAFTLSADPSTENNTQVYIDGVYQEKGTYAVSGTTLTFSTAPPNGTSIEVMAFTASSVGVVADGSISTAKLATDAVTTAKILNANVTADKLATDAVTTVKITDLNVTTAKIANDAITSAKIDDDAVGADQLASDAVVTASIVDDAVTLAKMASGTDGNLISYDASGNPVAVATGNAGQVLTSAGAGAPPTFATLSAGAYNDWAVKTDAYTLSNKDQIVVNKTSALTMTLPAGSAGNTVIIKATGGGTVTIGRNGSQKINSVAADATLMSGNGVQLVYVDDTIGWLEI
jgi:hypothetical protein